MPRFFFDVHDGSFVPDDVGRECVDHDEAYGIARAVVHQVAAMLNADNPDYRSIRMIVRDDNQKIVYTSTLTYHGTKMP